MGADGDGWMAAALGDLFAGLHRLVHRGDDRFRVLGDELDAIAHLTALADATEHSAWNLQRHVTLGGLKASHDINVAMDRRGVTSRSLVPLHVVRRTCPLLSSYDPVLRVAPVPHPLLVADRRTIVVGNAGGGVLHTTSDSGIVAAVVRTVDRVWHAAPPALAPGEPPPFTRRMVDIAFLLVEGGTDASIARQLGISQRTVSADVAEITRRLGARGRTHAIALVSGVA